MAAWDNPRHEIEQLRQHIQQLIAQQDEQRRQIQRESQQRINELENQYSEAFQRYASQTEAEFAARQREYQEGLLSIHKGELQRLAEYDRQVRKASEREVRRLSELCEQLKKELNDIQEKEQREEAMQRGEAAEQLRVAVEAHRRAEQTSHAFFFPNKLSLYMEALRRCFDFFHKNMFSAAAASAAAAQIDIEDLILDVQRKEQEWASLFDGYRTMVQRIFETLKAFRDERQRTLFDQMSGQEGRLLDDELRNYWSSGMYQEVAADIIEAERLVLQVDAFGITEYLRQGSQLHERQLLNAISGSRALEDRLTAVMVSIRSEIRFSDERYVVGRLIEDLLVRLNYVVLEASFSTRGEVESPLDSFLLKASLAGNVLIQVSIMPRRQDGIPISNECIVSISMSRLPERSVYESMMGQWRQRITSLLQQRGILGVPVKAYRADSSEFKAVLETQRHMSPDPLEYARKLALKY